MLGRKYYPTPGLPLPTAVKSCFDPRPMEAPL